MAAYRPKRFFSVHPFYIYDIRPVFSLFTIYRYQRTPTRIRTPIITELTGDDFETEEGDKGTRAERVGEHARFVAMAEGMAAARVAVAGAPATPTAAVAAPGLAAHARV